ncbi:MAG: MerR family DNA-binding transcriptional regulator [Candidatus Lokiarchaeota archaeon]|nr:MerR family DNA-binding transcriptional regulator [Candidatus Lokiarchaeota archaeon]
MYAIGAAADRLGVCRKTLHRWEAQGILKYDRTLGGHRRFPLSELNPILLKEGKAESFN